MESVFSAGAKAVSAGPLAADCWARASVYRQLEKMDDAAVADFQRGEQTILADLDGL